MAASEKVLVWHGLAVTAGGVGYLAALALSVVFAVIWRIAATPRQRVETGPVSPTELAFLRSEFAPVVTALASLRATGRVTSTRRVDHAVRGAQIDGFTARTLRRVTADAEHTVPRLCRTSRDDLAAMAEELGERGLVTTREQRRRIRLGVLPSVVLVVIGLGYGVYLLTRLTADPHVAATFTLILFPTVMYATFLLPWLLQVRRLTPAGRRLLARERKRLAYLDPAKRPAFETYGPAAVALSAALFGAGALRAVDAGYADAVQAPGVAGGGADGGGGCGGDGGGGGGCGSCGGCGGGGGGCGG
ncbi:TIGR04222 domain-containing membrane protein [Mycolicibacterium goodii]